jgi:hypothetical protein
VAIRRDENEDTYPHPSFCAMRVGFWNELGGDWREDAAARLDVGGRLAVRLQERGVEWSPLLRVNARDLHPVLVKRSVENAELARFVYGRISETDDFAAELFL